MALEFILNSNILTILTLTFLSYILPLPIYRLFLHPLKNIPGPKLAALTWWYEIYYDVYLPGQYNFKILSRHKQYGPIIRINPEEVHISDPDFLGEVYNARKRNKPPEPSLDIEGSVAGTAEWDLHKQRRAAMTSFFSPKAVRELEPLLGRKRDVMVDVVERYEGSGKVLNVSDLYFAYCWDLIQEYAFAIDSDVLSGRDLKEASDLRANSTDLLLQVNFTRYFGWINALAGYFPGGLGEKMIPPGVMDLKRVSQRVAKVVREVMSGDEKSSEKSSGKHRSIFYTIRDDPALPASEKNALRLQREGNFLVVAASDSPARAIHITHFYLLDNPLCMAKLRAELRPLGTKPSMEALLDLPYLNAVFLEGTRLMFGLARRIFRVAPDDPIVYHDKKTGKEYVVPAGWNVGISSLAVHGNEDIFPDPFAFKPERWLLADGVSPNKEMRKYHMSFGAKSPRSCLGIHLAEAEMKFAIAAVASYEMELFETSVKNVAYLHDYQMAHGDLNSLGIRTLVKGKAW
ncbi:Cytochrome P450 monooxygenase [Pseudocercospora fuligena]|uniref:Cytochrome P450 monooxygenase n=1 Tax=Pseudocercospora fuligena TaxID=685502 RepID=A0A8H6VJJ1_9PEZI|nr:Cytochrome P450 monooxygenase [Pseudocercospora fuligena]